MGSCISRLGYHRAPQYIDVCAPPGSQESDSRSYGFYPAESDRSLGSSGFWSKAERVVDDVSALLGQIHPHVEMMFKEHAESLNRAEIEAVMEKQLQAEAALAQAEHTRAHEMSHSVECLAMMLAKRIMLDREENNRRQEELVKIEEVNRLKEQIVKNFTSGEFREVMIDASAKDGSSLEPSDPGVFFHERTHGPIPTSVREETGGNIEDVRSRGSQVLTQEVTTTDGGQDQAYSHHLYRTNCLGSLLHIQPSAASKYALATTVFTNDQLECLSSGALQTPSNLKVCDSQPHKIPTEKMRGVLEEELRNGRQHL
jgi:hypothetical protein